MRDFSVRGYLLQNQDNINCPEKWRSETPQSVMGKRGQAGSPSDKQPHPLFLLPFSSPPPTLPSAFLPLSISFGKIHTLTKRMLSSAETKIHILWIWEVWGVC